MRYYTNQLKEMIGKKVKVAGWVHDTRILGGICFLILRDSRGKVQITASKDKVKEKIMENIKALRQEDTIIVEGKVVKNKAAPGGLEIIPSSIEVISKSATPLPLDPRGITKANLDTRLDWRVLDLRSERSSAIIQIQSKVVEGMEEFLRKNGFLQVFTPCIIGGISEGGADVFPVVYFDKQAFLRQDPQLHRQLTILAGYDKIFDLGPSWRAEPSHTTKHLCEHRGCAVEMGFIKDEHDTMSLEEQLVVAVLKKIKKECKEQLEILEKEIKIPKTPFPELRFPQLYDILAEFGKKLQFGQDLDRESEKILANYVKEKYKTDFFFVNRFPFKVKPFYVMRVDETPEWARSVDLYFKDIEQSSGGQREHRYEKIISQIREKGINPESLKWFTEPFKYGAIPHGGFNIGIERFVMALLDIKNIREVVLFPRAPERYLP